MGTLGSLMSQKNHEPENIVQRTINFEAWLEGESGEKIPAGTKVRTRSLAAQIDRLKQERAAIVNS